jgi:hypothetical protein
LVVWAVPHELRPDCGIRIGQDEADHKVTKFSGATEVALFFSVLATAEVAMTEARAKVAIRVFMIIWRGSKFLW